MPLEFDSSPNKLEIPEEFESAERQIKALAGAEFSFSFGQPARWISQDSRRKP